MSFNFRFDIINSNYLNIAVYYYAKNFRVTQNI